MIITKISEQADLKNKYTEKVGYNLKTMHRFGLCLFIFSLIFPLASCVERNQDLGQQEALEIAWDMLDPNTESHNRDDWEIHEAKIIYGQDVVAEFMDMRFSNCPGPAIPENQPIKGTSQYWYIKVVPHPEAMRRDKSTESSELVSVIPEPKINEASFLIDIYSGQVIARHLVCK
jgi:hypothetical protein